MAARSRFASLLVVLAACAPSGEPSGEVVLGVSAPIKGGYEDTSDKAVMGILHAASGSICTGTLIAPNVVLTARHCVSQTFDDAGGVICNETSSGPVHAGPGFFVTTADILTLGSAGEYFGELVVGLAGIDGIPGHTEDDSPLCGHDVAIIILQKTVPATKATPYLPRLAPDLAPGELYSAVGYGGEEDDGTGSGTRRRRDELAVSCIGSDCTDTVIPPSEIASDEWVGGGAVCRGDSGGPALDAENRVVGVTSRGTPGCQVSLYGHVASFSQWLKNTVVYASGMGAYPAPSWTEGATVDPEHSMPVGAPCASDAECPSGKCIEDGTPPYCTRACAETGPCPDGYACEARDGAMVCIDESPQPVSYQRPPTEGGCRISGRGEAGGGWLAGLLGLCVLAWRRSGARGPSVIRPRAAGSRGLPRPGRPSS